MEKKDNGKKTELCRMSSKQQLGVFFKLHPQKIDRRKCVFQRQKQNTLGGFPNTQ